MAAPLNTRQAAERHDVKQHALRKAAREGRVPGWKVLGQWRFDPDALAAAITRTRVTLDDVAGRR